MGLVMDQKYGLRTFNNIAKLIKSKRLEHPKGYSQSELSNLLGYKNGQFISNVERALCNIPFKMLVKICDILDIDEKELKAAILKDYEETLDSYLELDTKSESSHTVSHGTTSQSSEHNASPKKNNFSMVF